MLDRSLLKRITSNPEIFGGKPIIRGLRMSVELVLSLLAQRVRTEELLTTIRTCSQTTSAPAWPTTAP